MTVDQDDGLIGKIVVIWLVVFALFALAAIDGASILLSRVRLHDLATDGASAAAERFTETGRRREAVRAALETIAERDEDARLVELDVSEDDEITVVVEDTAGTVLVGRFGLLEDLRTATASDSAPSDPPSRRI